MIARTSKTLNKAPIKRVDTSYKKVLKNYGKGAAKRQIRSAIGTSTFDRYTIPKIAGLDIEKLQERLKDVKSNGLKLSTKKIYKKKIRKVTKYFDTEYIITKMWELDSKRANTQSKIKQPLTTFKDYGKDKVSKVFKQRQIRLMVDLYYAFKYKQLIRLYKHSSNVNENKSKGMVKRFIHSIYGANGVEYQGKYIKVRRNTPATINKHTGIYNYLDNSLFFDITKEEALPVSSWIDYVWFNKNESSATAYDGELVCKKKFGNKTPFIVPNVSTKTWELIKWGARCGTTLWSTNKQEMIDLSFIQGLTEPQSKQLNAYSYINEDTGRRRKIKRIEYYNQQRYAQYITSYEVPKTRKNYYIKSRRGNLRSFKAGVLEK